MQTIGRQMNRLIHRNEGAFDQMPNLFTGGRYIQERGFSIREIEQIHGDDIHWRDKFGGGQCSKQNFYRWLGKGSLAPDSPPAPPPAKRSKPITEDAIGRVRNDAAMLQKLKELSIKPEMDSQGVARFFLGAMETYITRIQEQAAGVSYNKRMRSFTRIDCDAQAAQSSITSLSDWLKSASATFPEECVLPLSKALSDGLESVNRLRGNLAPYLGQ
jgi:hypothetical protein